MSAETIPDPWTAPALSDAEVTRMQAEVEVDRVLVSLLLSLREDPTAESLRSFLLGHVLAGRESAAALLLLGRDAQAPSRLDRIEAKLDAVLSRSPGPSAPGRPGADLFDRPERAVPPGQAPGMRVRVPPPESRTASPRLARIVNLGLKGVAPEADGHDPAGVPGGEPPAPAAPAGPAHAAGARRNQSNGFGCAVRTFAKSVAEGLGRPVTPKEVYDRATPEMRDRIDSFLPRYLLDVLKRSCIRIGEDLYWPADRPLPEELGMGWDAARLRGLTATLPEAHHREADEARRLIEAYNGAAPAERSIAIGPEYSVTVKSRSAAGAPASAAGGR